MEKKEHFLDLQKKQTQVKLAQHELALGITKHWSGFVLRFGVRKRVFEMRVFHYQVEIRLVRQFSHSRRVGVSVRQVQHLGRLVAFLAQLVIKGISVDFVQESIMSLRIASELHNQTIWQFFDEMAH